MPEPDLSSGPLSDAALQIERRRVELEFERLRLERQKIGMEFRLRRRDLKAAHVKGWKEIFSNPLTLAIVGGFVTLMTTTIGNSINSSNIIAAEAAKGRQALQTDLIKRFVESSNRETVRTNLSFLADVGLLPDYAEPIRSYLRENPDRAPSAVALSGPISAPATMQEVRTDDDAIDLVIYFEGGYVETTTDPSGASNFGITLPLLTRFLGRDATKEELRMMPRSVAHDIYRKFYLEGVSPIKPISVKATYLSMAVSLGARRAMQITQTAIGKASNRSIPADGMLGPATVALVNSLDSDLLVETMACEWARFNESLPGDSRPGLTKRVRTYLPANPRGLCPDVLPTVSKAAAQ